MPFYRKPRSTDCAHYYWRYEAVVRDTLVILIGIFSISSCLAVENQRWPGLPPDCWTESRNVHAGESVDLESRTYPSVAFSHIGESLDGERIYSPNGAYYFITDGFRPNSIVQIFSEKATFWQLSFKDNFYPASPKWVSENLLFLRVYGGRIAFIDIVLNVEKEEVLYTDRGIDGYIAFQQYQEGCRTLGGCECIEKE